jgi:hypothetical protein
LWFCAAKLSNFSEYIAVFCVLLPIFAYIFCIIPSIFLNDYTRTIKRDFRTQARVEEVSLTSMVRKFK